jgi:hypothetical protein
VACGGRPEAIGRGRPAAAGGSTTDRGWWRTAGSGRVEGDRRERLPVPPPEHERDREGLEGLRLGGGWRGIVIFGADLSNPRYIY